MLANRLTQDGHFRVLLLEGGGEDHSPYIRVPAGLAKIDEKYNWRYTADPDPSRNGLVEHWGAGKVIGGSSSINGQVWTRGNAADYDEWAKLGADGWDGASVLPYFKRAERFEGGADQYRGDRGSQSVEYVRVRSRLTDAFVEAAQQAATPTTPTTTATTSLASATCSCHSAAAGGPAPPGRTWPPPAGANLKLEKQALATRVIIDGDRAVGVEYRQGGAHAHRPGPPRGAAQRGRAGIAEAPHAVRRRAGGRAAPARDRRHRGQPRGGTQPPGAHLGHGHVHGEHPQPEHGDDAQGDRPARAKLRRPRPRRGGDPAAHAILFGQFPATETPGATGRTTRWPSPPSG